MKITTLKDEDLRALKSITQGYVEAIQLNSTLVHDPFDLYAESLKSKFYTDSGHFFERFSRGYQALLQEIETNAP